MNRIILVVLIMVASLFLVMPQTAISAEDVVPRKGCVYCGMDLEKYDFSRMLIEYEDGTSTGVCSLHCAALELAVALDKTPASIKAADLNTKQMIDAEKAFWVLGGTRPAVMSKRGKWAFAKKEDAEAFLKQNNGSLVSFEAAIKAAYEDIYDDTKMIRERRKEKKMKMKMNMPGPAQEY